MKLYNLDGNLDPDVADVLYELGNVGVGMASVVIGKIMGVRVKIETPKVMPMNFDVADLIEEDPEKVAIGILMSMEKELGGVVLFIFEKRFITDIVEKLTGNKVEFDDKLVEDEENFSAIQEFSNIMAAAYMNAIGSYTGIRIFLSPVMVGVDMVAALVSYPMAQMEMECEKVICIDTSFALTDKDGNKESNTGHVIMLPDEGSVETLMKSLGL